MVFMFFLLIACAPIDAPEDFDALNSYLYEKFHEKPKYLEAGLENLYAWLPENEADLEEGYRVENLSSAAIESVEQTAPEELVGVATSIDINYSVDEIAYVHFGIDPEDLNPDEDAYNDREYLTDKQCFLDHSCDLVQYEAEIQVFLPLNIEIISYIFSEARWVDTEWGPAYIQRRYLTKEPEPSADWVNIGAEYGFIITLPQESGLVKRIEATWIDLSLDGLPVTEAMATQLGLSTLQSSIQETTTYLDTH